MATIEFLKRKDSKNAGALGSVIAYSVQQYKTEIDDTGVRLISGVNCIVERAFKDFMDTKRQFNKTNGVQFYYAIQSFEEDSSINPMLAHQMATEWVEECYPGYQAFICTHKDTDNIHNHIIINSVSSLNGEKIHQNGSDIQRVRAVNDKLCLKYGLPVCQSKNKKNVQGVTAKEYYAAMSGNSWKTKLAIDIDDSMLYAKSKMDFIKLMNEKGYKVIWTSKRETILYQCPNGKMCRDFKLHDEKYLKGVMELEFSKRKSILQRYERYDEKGTDSTDLYNGNGRKLEQFDKSVIKAEYHNGTATSVVRDDDNNRRDGRHYERTYGYDSNISDEYENNSEVIQDGYGKDSNGLPNTSTGTSGQSGEQIKRHDEGDIQTGWENERGFFEQSYRAKGSDEGYLPQAHDRQLDTDNNSDTVTWSIHFMGNLANLISTGNRRFRGKRVRLSQKEIEKRLASGQKTSGYEEYNDNDYTQTM